MIRKDASLLPRKDKGNADRSLGHAQDPHQWRAVSVVPRTLTPNLLFLCCLRRAGMQFRPCPGPDDG